MEGLLEVLDIPLSLSNLGICLALYDRVVARVTHVLEAIDEGALAINLGLDILHDMFVAHIGVCMVERVKRVALC